jgi:preprotein translocase subunit SecF
MVGIMLYVAWRFRHFDFGAAGVIALLHDVTVAAGALCLLGQQIDFIIVAALMTIAGFSINDTIVIYDRVRENLRLNRKLGLADVINLSVNQTLGRTLLTSLTVIFTVVALYCFGGEVLRSFSLCLLVGFISGVYSTVYIASALVVTWRRLFQPTST